MFNSAAVGDFDLREVGAGGVSTTIGVHVHHRGSCPLSGFTSTVRVHVHCHPRGDDQERRSEGMVSIHLMWLASSLEPSCPAGSYDTQTNVQATLY